MCRKNCGRRKKPLTRMTIRPVSGVTEVKSSRFKSSKFKVGNGETLNTEH
jgi:hypothetical protein